MQSVLGDIVQELESMLGAARELEGRYTGEILVLEKAVNQTRKTVYDSAARKEGGRKEEEKVEKVEMDQQDIDHRVDSMLEEIEVKQRMLEHNPRQKLEVKLPEIAVEKKPPIPTANRTEKSIRTPTHAFVPPRNRNDVTGKVTQTTIRASNQKLFKPELTGMKRGNSREMITTKPSFKGRGSEEKKKEETMPPKPEMPMKSSSVTLPKPMANTQNRQHSETKKPRVQLPQQHATFHRQIEQILDQVGGKGSRSRKGILQKMIKDCQNEEIGHKKQEEASRLSFIKHANNYAVSRNNVNPMVTDKITREKWQYYPQLFELKSILTGLEVEMTCLENVKEYRLDPRQEYRIIQTASKMSEIINRVEEDKGLVPDQLDLSFTHAEISEPTPPNQNDMQGLNEIQLNQHLNNLLEELNQSEQFQKPQLRGLQVLTQLGIFKSRKSPIICVQEEYQQWRDYYFDGNTC